MEEKNIKTLPLAVLILLILFIVIISIIMIINLSNLDIIPTFLSQKIIKECVSNVSVESNESLLANKMIKIDEGYILLSSKFNDSKKYYIEKYDENFNLLLSKELNAGSYNKFNISNIVKKTNGIYILGSVIDEDENKRYAMVVKIDNDLNIIFSDVSNENGVFAYKNILKYENESIYISGVKVHEYDDNIKEKSKIENSKNDTKSATKNVKYDLVVMEYNEYGALIKASVVKDNIYSYGYLATNTILSKDNNYLAYVYEEYGNKNAILKIDENLNIVWENKIEEVIGYDNSFIENISEDENLNVYAVIRYDKENSDECKMYIRKVSKDGVTLWQKELRITNAKSKVTSMSCDSGIYIQSCTNKYNTKNESNVLRPVLLKYDYDGNYIWNVTIKDDIKYDTGIFFSLIENKKLKIFTLNGVVGSGTFKSTMQDNYNLMMYEYSYKTK